MVDLFFKRLPMLGLILLSVLGCRNNTSQPKEKSSKEVVINLEFTAGGKADDFAFPSNYQAYPIFSTKDISEEQYLQKLKNFKLPKLDTFLIVTESFKHGTFFREIMLKDNYGRTQNFFKDSLQMFNDGIEDKLNILSGFSDTLQILIPDLNNNQDFTDDPILNYKRTDSDDEEKIDSLQTLNFDYKLAYNKNIINGNRKIQIYPDPHQKYTEYLNNDLSKKLAVSFLLKDYGKGEYLSEKGNYTVAIQGINKDRAVIIIKPDQTEFNKDEEYNNNFIYKVGDTVQLGEEFFKIKSIDNKMSKLIFERINSENLDFTGYRMGNILEDYKITSLDNGNLPLSEMINLNKKYTLIDFWGTWCQPCLELTPELKRIKKGNEKKLNIVSIAFDDSVEKVREYVLNNDMVWPQAFVDRNNRKDITRDLRIITYPTFILLDQNKKIIYRGSGKGALSNIENLLSEATLF